MRTRWDIPLDRVDEKTDEMNETSMNVGVVFGGGNGIGAACCRLINIFLAHADDEFGTRSVGARRGDRCDQTKRADAAADREPAGGL